MLLCILHGEVGAGWEISVLHTHIIQHKAYGIHTCCVLLMYLS